MRRVFISSVIRDFEEYRTAAATAVRRFGWVAVLSEDLAAQDRSPRAALLDEVASADVYLLLLGGRYGAAVGQASPTEDEYEEAVRRGKPIIVMLQEGVERELAQEEFAARVTSGWAGGRIRAGFQTPEALMHEITLALRQIELESSNQPDTEGASERARSLAAGEGQRGYEHGGEADARIAVVPLGLGRVVTATMLNSGSLPGQLAEALRRAGLADALTGFEQRIDANQVRVTERSDRFANRRLRLTLDTQGSLLVEGQVTGEGQLGEMWVDPARLTSFIRGSLAVAPIVWSDIGVAAAVRQAAIQLALPRAGSRSYGAPAGSSISMGGLSRLDIVFSPPDPAIVSVQRLADEAVVEELVAHVERAFRDVGAVNS